MRPNRAIGKAAVLAVAACLGVAGYIGYQWLASSFTLWSFEVAAGRLNAALSGQRILETRVRLRVIVPDSGDRSAGAAITLKASADLTMLSDEVARGHLVLLLNPGLTVGTATIDGRTASHFQRDGFLYLRSPVPLDQGQRIAVHLDYEGFPGASPLMGSWGSGQGIGLPMLALWYPLDLRSFSSFQCEATIPEAWIPVLDDALVTITTANGARRVEWKEKRPVLGVTFVAGRYQKHGRTHGAIRCALFLPFESAAPAEDTLDTLGSAYSFLHTTYESDGFDAVCAVVDPRASEAFNGGNSVLVFPMDMAADPHRRFAEFARQIAHNWWGATVTSRWFTDKPEAASWIVDGFAEYSAWLALRNVQGRAAYLRRLESLRCPATIDFPMKSIALMDRFETARPNTETDPSIRDVRQAYMVETFAARIGEDHFHEACRNILKIYRYESISYSAALQELELASEVDLHELFRVWFERGGTFDYGVSEVTSEEGAVRIAVVNQGDIPALMDMSVALITDAGVEFRTADVGAHGGSFLFPVTAPVKTVVLDPEFVLPDMVRANNTWPRVRWPRGIAASDTGRLALTAATEWTSPLPDAMAIISPDGHSIDRIGADAGIQGGPVWAEDGQRLLFQAGNTFIWETGKGETVVAGKEFAPVGWVQNSILMTDAAKRKNWYVAAPPRGPRRSGPCATPPAPLSLCVAPDAGTLAYRAVGSGNLCLLTYPDLKTTNNTAPAIPIGAMSWSRDGAGLIFVSKDGMIGVVHMRGGETDTILQLGYPVRSSAVSNSGEAVAWLDPQSRLWYCRVHAPMPRIAELPGEPVSFTWEGSDAILALVAEIPPQLPMLYHARYSVWRVPADGQPATRLPLDPARIL